VENCDLRAIELDSRHHRIDGRAVEAVYDGGDWPATVSGWRRKFAHAVGLSTQ
jgi:hypothetical protein